MKIRLNKFIADAGIASRRKADELIRNRKVKVNDKIISALGTQIEPDTDKVTIDSELIEISEKIIYFAVNKPKGIISSAKDEKGRKTVIDLIDSKVRVYPIGRLDSESQGLMILTNDGELTQILTHPSFAHEKEYKVKIRIKNEKLRIKDIEEQFLKGIIIDEKLMKADRISIKTLNAKILALNLILHTGYNRQIRKMCAKLGLEVLELERVRIGNLRLEDLNLRPGEYKEITKHQII